MAGRHIANYSLRRLASTLLNLPLLRAAKFINI
jgi:hypothetical protein